MMMVVRQFPPRESCRIRVILLSLYGTWVFYKHTTDKITKKIFISYIYIYIYVMLAGMMLAGAMLAYIISMQT